MTGGSDISRIHVVSGGGRGRLCIMCDRNFVQLRVYRVCLRRVESAIISIYCLQEGDAQISIGRLGITVGNNTILRPGYGVLVQ